MYKFRLVFGVEALDAFINTSYEEAAEFVADYVGFGAVAGVILLIFGLMIFYKLFQKTAIRGAASLL